MRKNMLVARAERTQGGRFRITFSPIMFTVLDTVVELHLQAACALMSTFAEETIKRRDQLAIDIKAISKEEGIDLKADDVIKTMEQLAKHEPLRETVLASDVDPAITVEVGPVAAAALQQEIRAIVFNLKKVYRDQFMKIADADLLTNEDLEQVYRVLSVEDLEAAQEDKVN